MYEKKLFKDAIDQYYEKIVKVTSYIFLCDSVMKI